MSDELFLILLFAGLVLIIALTGRVVSVRVGRREGVIIGLLLGALISGVLLTLTIADPTPGGTVDLIIACIFDVGVGIVGATFCVIPNVTGRR